MRPKSIRDLTVFHENSDFYPWDFRFKFTIFDKEEFLIIEDGLRPKDPYKAKDHIADILPICGTSKAASICISNDPPYCIACKFFIDAIVGRCELITNVLDYISSRNDENLGLEYFQTIEPKTRREEEEEQ